MELSALHPYFNELMKGTTYGSNVNRDGCSVVDRKRRGVAGHGGLANGEQTSQ